MERRGGHEQPAPLALAEHPEPCSGDVRSPDPGAFRHPGEGLLRRQRRLRGHPGPARLGAPGVGGQGPDPGGDHPDQVQAAGDLDPHPPGRGLSPAAAAAGQRPLRPLRQGHLAPAGQPPHGGHRGGPAGQPLWGDGRPEVRHGPGPPGPGGGQRQRPRGGCRRPPGGPPGRGRGGVGAGQRHRRDLPRRQPGPLRRRGRRGGPAQ